MTKEQSKNIYNGLAKVIEGARRVMKAVEQTYKTNSKWYKCEGDEYKLIDGKLHIKTGEESSNKVVSDKIIYSDLAIWLVTKD